MEAMCSSKMRIYFQYITHHCILEDRHFRNHHIEILESYTDYLFSSGNPSIQKCKRLRKKIETRREVQELDVGNIMEEKGEFW